MTPGDPRPLEQVLKPECIADYKKAHEDIWHRLIDINTSIQILETIAKYPLHHLCAPHDPFWHMLYWNFTYTCVVLLYALVDRRRDSLHLTALHDRLTSAWLLPGEQAPFRERVDPDRFHDSVNSVRRKVAAFRHKVIAHRDTAVASGSLQVPGLSIPDLRALYDETESLFAACSFQSEYDMSPYPGRTGGGRPVETDIERLMNLIVRHSPWLNQPERHGTLWPDIRSQKNPDELAELNHWRQHSGLPTI
jgi:hypothetical protein